jgi:DNA excision repair protein ERCC-2
MEEWTRLLASLRPAESLDPATEAEVHDHVAKLANLVSTQSMDYAALGPHHAETLWSFAQLAEFMDDSRLTKLLWVAREGELEFTCVDAAPAIGETLKAFGGAILMSATLQPYADFATSCGLESSATLHAPTPWRVGAYDVAVDLRVSTTFRERANHYGTTAETIEAMFGAARSAVAVFFSVLCLCRVRPPRP